jgi:hypothetical protein
MNPLVAYVIGCTNTGKSSLMEASYQYAPEVRCIEIGKYMRAKYPPSHFKGQGNPKHTADEAWAVYTEQLQKAFEDPKCRLVLADGQPRDQEQMEAVMAAKGFTKVFLHLWASRSVREARARKRDGEDKEKLALSLARLDNDVLPVFDIVTQLSIAGYDVRHVNTQYEYSPGGLIKSLIQESKTRTPRP